MYKIENDIEVPPVHPITKRAQKFPFLDMEIGQSIMIDGEINQGWRMALWRIRKQYGREFTQRKIDGNFRIWRIK